MTPITRSATSSEEEFREDVSLLEKGELINSPSPLASKATRTLWIAQFLLFTTSAFMFYSSITRHQKIYTQQCLEELNGYSPIHADVHGNDRIERFNGIFTDKSSSWQGPPSPKVDAAWEDITLPLGGVISISPDTLRKTNASTYTVELPSSMGGGYMASVEVLHQLHCLDFLRQATYVEYYRDKSVSFQDDPETVRYHLDHCIDSLRQKLMCDADARIMTFVWVKGYERAFPDFRVQHKCRNFQGVIDWVKENQVYQKKGSKIERMPGAREMQHLSGEWEG